MLALQLLHRAADMCIMQPRMHGSRACAGSALLAERDARNVHVVEQLRLVAWAREEVGLRTPHCLGTACACLADCPNTHACAPGVPLYVGHSGELSCQGGLKHAALTVVRGFRDSKP